MASAKRLNFIWALSGTSLSGILSNIHYGHTQWRRPTLSVCDLGYISKSQHFGKVKPNLNFFFIFLISMPLQNHFRQLSNLHKTSNGVQVDFERLMKEEDEVFLILH